MAETWKENKGVVDPCSEGCVPPFPPLREPADVPVVVAQPYAAHQGTYAAYPSSGYPGQAQFHYNPQGVPGQPQIVSVTQQQQHQQQQQQQQQQDAEFNPPPPRGFWGSNICDWPRNLFPSCWCACCCLHGSWIVAQMSEKTGYASFRTVLGGYTLMWIIAIIVAFFNTTSSVVWMPAIFMMLINIGLRLHIVKQRGITQCGSPANGCGNLTGEALCGFCCGPCAIAQQARFLYGYTRAFDGDARIDRRDQYSVVQMV